MASVYGHVDRVLGLVAHLGSLFGGLYKLSFGVSIQISLTLILGELNVHLDLSTPSNSWRPLSFGFFCWGRI